MRNNSNIWLKASFFVAATLIAALFGLLSISNNPILIGLAMGSFIGAFLLYNPKVPIWIIVVFGLSTPAILDMIGQTRVLWAFSMMGMLMWVPGLAHLVAMNPGNKKYTPLFIWLIIFFVMYAITTTVLQVSSFGELISGFKRYFQTYGLIVALASLPLLRKDFDLWLKVLLLIAFLQLPFALFERIILVPLRGGIEVAGGQATDVVAGTMGANLKGGSPNSIMVVILLSALAFVFSRWKEKLLSIKQLCLYALLLLLPLALGETKIVILLLPLVGLFIIGKDLIYAPMKYIPWLLGLLALTFLFGYVYIHVMLDTTLEDFVIGTLKYNTGEVGYGELVLNRFTSVTFWLSNHNLSEPISFLFGHGLGSSYGNGYNAGHVAQSYPGYGIALTTISTILWDLGVVGLAIYVAIFVLAWLQINNIQRLSPLPKTRADCMGVKVGIMLTMALLLYSNTQVNLITHELIIAMLLGYGAFLIKEHHTTVGASK